MTYTLENIPDHLDRALRERAVAEHKSPEAVIIDLVASGLSTKASHACRKDACPDHTADGEDDREFDAALRDQSLIDWDAWCDGIQRRDLSGIAGQHLITPEMKAVFAEQRRIDPELWK